MLGLGSLNLRHQSGKTVVEIGVEYFAQRLFAKVYRAYRGCPPLSQFVVKVAQESRHVAPGQQYSEDNLLNRHAGLDEVFLTLAESGDFVH